MSAHDTKFKEATELCAEARKQLRDLSNAIDDEKFEGIDIRPCKKCHKRFYNQFDGLKQELDNLSSKLNEDLNVEDPECTCLKEECGRQAEEHCMKEDIGISGSEVITRKEEEKGRQHTHTNDSGYVSANLRFSRLEDEGNDPSRTVKDSNGRESECNPNESASVSDENSLISENVSDSEAEHNASRNTVDSYNTCISDLNKRGSLSALTANTDISFQDESKNDVICADPTDCGTDKSESVLDEKGSIQIGHTNMISMKPTVSLEGLSSTDDSTV